MRALICKERVWAYNRQRADPGPRKVNEDSILAIQIFDQKKFKKKDQGFLGVINVRIGSVIDLEVGADGSIPVLGTLDIFFANIV